MKDTKHTPPDPGWTVHHFLAEGKEAAIESGLYEIEEANEQINAMLDDGDFPEALAMAEANRRLIALAPEMADFVREIASGPECTLAYAALRLLDKLETV